MHRLSIQLSTLHAHTWTEERSTKFHQEGQWRRELTTMTQWPEWLESKIREEMQARCESMNKWGSPHIHSRVITKQRKFYNPISRPMAIAPWCSTVNTAGFTQYRALKSRPGKCRDSQIHTLVFKVLFFVHTVLSRWYHFPPKCPPVVEHKVHEVSIVLTLQQIHVTGIWKWERSLPSTPSLKNPVLPRIYFLIHFIHREWKTRIPSDSKATCSLGSRSFGK